MTSAALLREPYRVRPPLPAGRPGDECDLPVKKSHVVTSGRPAGSKYGRVTPSATGRNTTRTGWPARTVLGRHPGDRGDQARSLGQLDDGQDVRDLVGEREVRGVPDDGVAVDGAAARHVAPAEVRRVAVRAARQRRVPHLAAGLAFLDDEAFLASSFPVGRGQLGHPWNNRHRVTSSRIVAEPAGAPTRATAAPAHLVARRAAQLPDRLDHPVHAVQVRLGQVPAVRVDRQRAVRPRPFLDDVPPGLTVRHEPVGLQRAQRHVGGGVVELGDVDVTRARPRPGRIAARRHREGTARAVRRRHRCPSAPGTG